LRSAASSALGLVVTVLAFALLIRQGSVGPLVLVVPLLTNWLLVQAPTVAASTKRGYARGLVASAFGAALTGFGALSGIVPTAVLLDRLWSPYSVQPDTLLFWLIYLAAAWVGAATLAPLNLWAFHREVRRTPKRGLEPRTGLALSLRVSWPVVVVAFALLAVTVVLALSGKLFDLIA
jgi:hypothetical protein